MERASFGCRQILRILRRSHLFPRLQTRGRRETSSNSQEDPRCARLEPRIKLCKRRAQERLERSESGGEIRLLKERGGRIRTGAVLEQGAAGERAVEAGARLLICITCVADRDALPREESVGLIVPDRLAV